MAEVKSITPGGMIKSFSSLNKPHLKTQKHNVCISLSKPGQTARFLVHEEVVASESEYLRDVLDLEKVQSDDMKHIIFRQFDRDVVEGALRYMYGDPTYSLTQEPPDIRKTSRLFVFAAYLQTLSLLDRIAESELKGVLRRAGVDGWEHMRPEYFVELWRSLLSESKLRSLEEAGNVEEAAAMLRYFRFEKGGTNALWRGLREWVNSAIDVGHPYGAALLDGVNVEVLSLMAGSMNLAMLVATLFFIAATAG